MALSPFFITSTMATFKELIYSVIEDVKGYNVTDDNLLHPDLIASLLNSIRMTLIGQEKMLHSSYFQRYPCLEVKCEKGSCVVDGLRVYGDKIYYVDPPPILQSLGKASISFLGSEGFKVRYSEIDITQFDKSDHMPYGLNNKFFARVGGRIFLKNYNPDDGKKLLLIALFSDPRDVLTCIEGDDIEYPVPSEYKLRIMAKKDILSSLGIPGDINDDAADIVQQQKQQAQ